QVNLRSEISAHVKRICLCQSSAYHVILGESLGTFSHATLDELERQVCVLIVRKICFHLPPPSSRVRLILPANLFQKLWVDWTVRLQRVLVACMVAREISEL